MSFTLGQYDYDGNPKDWLSPSTSIIPVTILTKKETEQTNEIRFNNSFKDIGFRYSDTNFSTGSTYYCHVAIKKQSLLHQTYDIKLINSISASNGKAYCIDNEVDIQQIDTIEVVGTNEDNNDWYFIDFVFTPLMDNYNTIYFDLTRMNLDYSSENNGRIPEIIMMELSVVENLNQNKTTETNTFPGDALLKIGVQSGFGLRMVLNKEEIYVGRTGIYEFKNTDIPIVTIGMIAQAQSWGKNSLTFDNIKTILKEEYTIEELYTKTDNKDIFYINPNSAYHFYKEVDSSRSFQPFTIDYVYEYKI